MPYLTKPIAALLALIGVAGPALAQGYYMAVPSGYSVASGGGSGSGTGGSETGGGGEAAPPPEDTPNSGFALHPNGITVTCADAQVGTEAVFMGKTWLVADNDSWSAETSKKSGFKHLCTTHVTEMRGDPELPELPSWPYGDAIQTIPTWDTSNVSVMYYVFSNSPTFNQPLSAWDTSKVTDMNGLFANLTAFNQPVGNWDVSKVVSMGYLFYRASSFNQPLPWSTPSLTDIQYAFYEATSFNQPLSTWDTSNVIHMDYAFYGASSFDQVLVCWDVEHNPWHTGIFEGTPISSKLGWLPRWGTWPYSECVPVL